MNNSNEASNDSQTTQQPESIDFTKIAKDSEKSITNAQQAQSPPKPRGGARAGAGRKSKNQTEQSNQTSNSNGLPNSNEATSPSQESNPSPIQRMDYSPFIKPQVKQVGRYFAQRTNCPDIAFSDEEATDLTEVYNNLLQQIMPEPEHADPKTQAIIAAAVTTLGMFALKMQTLKAHQAKLETQPPQPNAV